MSPLIEIHLAPLQKVKPVIKRRLVRNHYKITFFNIELGSFTTLS